MIRKPMLASDWDEKKQKFPILIQPKIDGVRGWNPDGSILARSMKPLRNLYNRELFSRPEYKGLDLEFAAADGTHPRLVSLTTSATATIEGEPYLMGHAFDYVDETTVKLPYIQRHEYLTTLMHIQRDKGLCGNIRVVKNVMCRSLAQLNEQDAEWLELGYEGTIIRDPLGMHKAGRSTVKEGGLLRIKRFVQEEAIVLEIREAMENNNEQTINELGRSTRSSHQENKTPKGMVGSMICSILKDSDLFRKGQVITVGKGDMTDQEAKFYFENPQELAGKIITFKHFPKGVKNQPRFPTWKSIRDPNDMDFT
jgi:DNA ligase-1